MMLAVQPETSVVQDRAIPEVCRLATAAAVS